MFLAISIPREERLDIKILDSAYLATASIPIAPIYLLHLSLTLSSSTLIVYYLDAPDSGS